ncbi:MAG: HEAT repeat domain-containing protein [Planctomycetota bacterium]
MAGVACAGEPDSGPPDGMPISLYQKLKTHFDDLYGARAALLPDVQHQRADIEKALRVDAEANQNALIKALGSISVLHRDMAARALEYCGDKKAAVEALGKVVTGDIDETVRRAAAAALAKLPDAAAVENLIQALNDSSDSVRGICATALGNIKDARAAGPLLRVLGDDAKPLVRLQAATALLKIKEPTTLDGLKKALENEQDVRVKMAIAGAIRNVLGADSAQTKNLPTTEEAANELASLAKEMKEVEAKLRDERHDQAVQVQGVGIEQKLSLLIEKLEKASSDSSPSSGSGDKQRQKQQQQTGGQKNQGKSGGSPLNDSKLGSAVPSGALNPALVAGQQDAWARLPPAQRDELLQAFRDDVPVRWQKRLQAYFYSINTEEAKSMENK